MLQRSGRQHRVYIVHRLDRDTSGLLMFAKDEKTQNTLRDNWHNIVTDRRYVAVVAGEMENNAGMVRSWLTDRKAVRIFQPHGRWRQGSNHPLPHHQTRQRLLARGTDAGDGTQNQIARAHAGFGTSHRGDGRYGLEEINPIGRLALHAFKLCFRHPVTGELMQFETPYPGEFKKLFSEEIKKKGLKKPLINQSRGMSMLKPAYCLMIFRHGLHGFGKIIRKSVKSA